MEKRKLPISLQLFQQELKLPLKTILEMVHFLNQEPLTLQQQKYVGAILESANRLFSLVNMPQIFQLHQNHHVNYYPDRKKKILLVEDDRLVQRLHKEMLTSLGHYVDIAKNGKEAIQIAPDGYDLIFLDIGLPDHDGITVCKTIRCRDKAIPIIALTTNGEAIRQRCLEAGMNDVLQKPATLYQLNDFIEKWFFST